MAISISLIALLGIAVFLLYKFAALKVWHALVCILFGFYLASSSVAPEIRTTVTSVIHAITGRGLHARYQEEVVNTTDRSNHNTDLQEVAARHDTATAAVAKLGRALDTIPLLSAEIRRLRRRLATTLYDLNNLIAAARATLGAHADGEDDPLYYLRDELHAQGRDRNQERP